MAQYGVVYLLIHVHRLEGLTIIYMNIDTNKDREKQHIHQW